MRGVNKVILVGALGADPEMRYTANGDAVATLSLATSNSWKDQQGQQQEKTEWHRVVLWKGLAELAQTYLSKGSKLYLEGELRTRKWQDQQGNDRYTTEIVGKNMQFLGGNRSEGNSQGGSKPNQYQNPDGTPMSPQQVKQAQNKKQQEPDFDFDDDIPF